MNGRLLSSSLISFFTLTFATPLVHANALSAMQDFTRAMDDRNVITSGSFSTDSHVHGRVAVGTQATLSRNAEINSHGTTNEEALRVYGQLNLLNDTKVLAGGATVVKNTAVNTQLDLRLGYPNPNQATIASPRGTLTFNGNGGTPSLTALSTTDSYFSSREGTMDKASKTLLESPALASTRSGGRLTFAAASAGVSVFNWDVSKDTGVNEVGFSFANDSFIVVNVIGGYSWNASFNTLGGSDFLASHVLWNIGVQEVVLTGSELLGSILAPHTTISSYKQLNGSIFAGSLNQHGQEIHYREPSVRVPDAPSYSVLALAAASLGLAGLSKRLRRK